MRKPGTALLKPVLSGTVQMPVTETFFNPGFGMCTDRFGTPWMVLVELQLPTG